MGQMLVGGERIDDQTAAQAATLDRTAQCCGVDRRAHQQVHEEFPFVRELGAEWNVVSKNKSDAPIDARSTTNVNSVDGPGWARQNRQLPSQ